MSSESACSTSWLKLAPHLNKRLSTILPTLTLSITLKFHQLQLKPWIIPRSPVCSQHVMAGHVSMWSSPKPLKWPACTKYNWSSFKTKSVCSPKKSKNLNKMQNPPKGFNSQMIWPLNDWKNFQISLKVLNRKISDSQMPLSLCDRHLSRQGKSWKKWRQRQVPVRKITNVLDSS